MESRALRRSRNHLLPAAVAVFTGASIVFSSNTFGDFVPAAGLRSHPVPQRSTFCREAPLHESCSSGEEAGATEHGMIFAGLFATLVFVFSRASPVAAASGELDVSSQLLAVLPPEEQQGYVQNALGYFNLILNFSLGFFGVVFGGLIRTAGKPGVAKYFVGLGLIGVVVFFALTVRGMIAMDMDVPDDIS
ncbi:unnamed protein product [Polarella glacialis]|nr:unnamed protein product [Polarella glacialis]